MLRIWGRTNSVNVQKVLWCATELGLEYERFDAGLEFGRNREDWYLALNPNGRVPLLQDGDFALWESNTIVRYLCAEYPQADLYPPTPRLRADVERWMDWQLSILTPPVSIAFWNLIRTPPGERDLDAVAAAVTTANAALDLLDRQMTGRRFVGGAAFSMGDIPVGAMTYRWLAIDGIERPAWPALRRWQNELASRPAFRRHVMLPLS
jgi:glutathione S-transferase